MQRVDQTIGGGTGIDIYTGHFQMFSNFSSGIEWYYNVNTGECEEFGLDYWNDWCYGTVGQSQTFYSQNEFNGQTVNTWQNGEFFYTSSSSSCLPVINSRVSGDLTMFYDVNTSPIDPSVFIPPAVCHTKTTISSDIKHQRKTSPNKQQRKHENIKPH